MPFYFPLLILLIIPRKHQLNQERLFNWKLCTNFVISVARAKKTSKGYFMSIMSFMSFRPDNIGKVFGQDHLQDLLLSWIDNPTLIPRSILFAGPYGVGKTTLARIIANNIVQSKNDLKEINAANARGIDDTRSWAESAQFSPLGNGGKVYIIDELHQMTNAAQSAMLKVIEEPPPNVYFFLCTMEPYKLLPAIRSRCTILELKLLSLQDTAALLSFVFQNKIKKDLINAIHIKSGGHARDAIKMAEVAITTNVCSLEELNQKLGFGRIEIENVIRLILKNLSLGIESNSEVQTIRSLSDMETAGQALDSIIDEEIFNGNKFIKSNYKDFIQMRVAKREYKITAFEQITHFISLF